MKEAKRIAFFLPNTFTALNMGCGFGSILFSFKGEFYYAAMILLLGAIFDLVDGRVARLMNAQSTFGEYFDSLSDVVSFGVAPAFLMFNCFFKDFGRIGQVVAFVYLLCGALRLARFNANIDRVSSNFFQGLPIPMAALALVGLVLFSLEVPAIMDYSKFTLVYSTIFALLMISNIPFYSFKDSHWAKAHKKTFLVIIFLVLALLVANERIMIFSIINTYVIGCLIYFVIYNKNFKGHFSWDNEGDHEK
ncbi:MAG: CDP-diacylglycerol--serine O-phosphatidyltransferase [Epsilonproteobacteria bacterium]|nr:MAG: CDP-diacylglycerol--serine O-phosphatidyltransferase [Campylobacterota bacterium]RLA66270.1 MAG: CDP-diacylglycerol--serine O-phosphatidyltransferase [Campylobacterota bacterium]